jgi:CDP-glucose 4,6-dehydratase
MTSVIGDINNLDLLQQTIATLQPEIIFHLAAQSLVRPSYHDPVATYATNVMGTVKMLEAARQSDAVKTIINVTTDKCYENQEWHYGYREIDRLGGHDPYSNSKACAELVTDAYRNSFLKAQGIGCATVRAGNVIGGGDWASERLVPDAIRACRDKQPLVIRYPAALRPWQHVLEPLGGYLLLAQRLQESPLDFAEAWNFGPDENDVKPVSWLADHIIKQWQSKINWQHDKSQHSHEANLLLLDCSKVRTKLSWRPRWNLERGLTETVNWYQAFFARQNMQEITVSQIQRFMSEVISEPTEDSTCVLV